MEISVNPKTIASQVRGGAAKFGVQVTLVVNTKDRDEIQSLRKQWDEIEASEGIAKLLETIATFEEQRKADGPR